MVFPKVGGLQVRRMYLSALAPGKKHRLVVQCVSDCYYQHATVGAVAPGNNEPMCNDKKTLTDTSSSELEGTAVSGFRSREWRFAAQFNP